MHITDLLFFAVALFIHEAGHLLAARACGVNVMEFGLGWGRKLYGRRLGTVDYNLHALPIGAYVRLDIKELQQKPLSQQVLVLLAGIFVNLAVAYATLGTRFSMLNLLLAATNLLPLYQQDGWKCGMVCLRAILRRKSALVEWTFTIVGSALSLIVFAAQAFRHS
ncbi:MAG: site-2 protease family protein [Pyrinomonadaceae bacterium]